MEIGITGEQSITVTKELTAAAMGSGTLPVYATPAMIALMEQTASLSVAEHLADGQSTVGTLIHIQHLAPSAVGEAITCRSTLTEIDGRRLTFEVCTYSKEGCIGKGVHERFLINNEAFLAKLTPCPQAR